MPLPTDVGQKITSIVAARLKRHPGTLDRQARFREDLGADSLDLLELVFTLEEELGTSIPDAEAAELRTLADVLGYVERRRVVSPARSI